MDKVIDKILVAIDFSEESLYGLDSALSLARTQQAEIILAYVVEDVYVHSFQTMGMMDDHKEENLFLRLLIEKTEERLEALIAQEQEVNMRYKINIGKAFDEVLKIIDHIQPDLVVMGSKGSTGLSEIFVGSNAEKMSRFSPCPVITVKKKRDLSAIKNIVYATDLRFEQESIVTEIKKLQKMHDAQLHVLKVFEPVWVSDKDVQKRLEAFISHFGLSNCTTHTWHDADESEGILRFAGSVQADMIALGTHARKGLGAILGGYISKHVINHAHIPIWTKSIHQAKLVR